MVLSLKQQKFLDFIQHYTIEYGQAPSYEEIMNGMGFASLGTVHWYVNALTHNGHLDRSKGPNGKRALNLVHEEHAMPARLPLLGLIAAGEPIEALENAEAISVPQPFVHPENFVLQVKGDSMIGDHIEDGDYIIVRKSAEANPGQIVVALINGEATLKHYQPINGHVELHPRNPDYPVITVNKTDHFQINGVLLYSFREY
ncbi:MAG: repressor LexA [Candidatus Marinimicrobia bacterium]|jgi:repressor LexA|nr:repressor LexA [Candidatus Neomarinimicrobiota bacterium]MBT3675202.1 repressor LexA [Candidatus Neomarinimicrobiota bacterium]MBT3763576.1 repressor LexA [Candidatus Neomarinimicrobiota bacterium]MBT4069553.1 repressor LexA [Candidatus Neomarinimicrobiota bacterium]MBT4271321.1 repressor LexA [Candidatus Neomarinimicrobiota bacterium]